MNIPSRGGRFQQHFQMLCATSICCFQTLIFQGHSAFPHSIQPAHFLKEGSLRSGSLKPSFEMFARNSKKSASTSSWNSQREAWTLTNSVLFDVAFWWKGIIGHRHCENSSDISISQLQTAQLVGKTLSLVWAVSFDQVANYTRL